MFSTYIFNFCVHQSQTLEFLSLLITFLLLFTRVLLDKKFFVSGLHKFKIMLLLGFFETKSHTWEQLLYPLKKSR